MQLLDPATNLPQFYRALVTAPERIIMLDYDGTIAPFRTDRERAVPYPGVAPLLEALQFQDRTRLVIVTGRSIDDVVPLLELTPLPEIWGSHGMERLAVGGRYEIAQPDPAVPEGALAVTKWAQAQDMLDRIEQKPFGVAFHWRGLAPDECERMADMIRAAWETESERYGMILTRFDGGYELRAKEMNKGRAVRYVLESSHPDAVAAYLGDDYTDEDAFAAIKGRGLAVLIRTTARESTADIWLTPPEELMDFLHLWLNPDTHAPDWLTSGNGQPKLSS